MLHPRRKDQGDIWSMILKMNNAGGISGERQNMEDGVVGKAQRTDWNSQLPVFANDENGTKTCFRISRKLITISQTAND